MLYAISKGKSGRNLGNSEINWRELFRSSEDSLTSFVFERLCYLPPEMLKDILLPQSEMDLGKLRYKDFWPHWDSTGTNNQKFVEPDLFLCFEKMNVIVEAKRYDNDTMQDKQQWKNEVIAYFNEYDDNQMDVCLLAIGGISGYKEHADIEVNGKKIPVLCYLWKDLLKRIQNQLNDAEGVVKEILVDLVSIFQIHGFSTGLWFEDFDCGSLKLANYDMAKEFFSDKIKSE